MGCGSSARPCGSGCTCTLAAEVAPGAGDRPDEGQLGAVWLPLARLPQTRLSQLGSRSLLGGAADEGCPVYLGDLA